MPSNPLFLQLLTTPGSSTRTLGERSSPCPSRSLYMTDEMCTGGGREVREPDETGEGHGHDNSVVYPGRDRGDCEDMERI